MKVGRPRPQVFIVHVSDCYMRSLVSVQYSGEVTIGLLLSLSGLCLRENSIGQYFELSEVNYEVFRVLIYILFRPNHIKIRFLETNTGKHFR